jgi:hypothetical protein
MAAGRNAVIGGGFDIWQRGTSFTATGFSADRWYSTIQAGSGTFSRGTTTPPNGSQYYWRFTSGTSNSTVNNYTAIESSNVIPLRGQTVTLSAYVRGTYSGNITFGYYYSNSSDALTTVTGSPTGSGFVTPTISSSWVRQTYTFTVPTDAVGLAILIASYSVPIVSGQTFDIWGVQLEIGSVPTTFSRAGGTIQGELAACQRYYYRTTADSAYTIFGNGSAVSTTQANAVIPLPVTLRINPSSVESASLALFDGVSVVAVTSTVLQYTGRNSGNVNLSVASGLTQYRPYFPVSNNTTSGYIAFNAEL